VWEGGVVSSGRARGGWWVIFWGWDPHNQPEGLWLCGSGLDLGHCGVGLWMGGRAQHWIGRGGAYGDRGRPADAARRGSWVPRGYGQEDGPGAVYSCWACFNTRLGGPANGAPGERLMGRVNGEQGPYPQAAPDETLFLGPVPPVRDDRSVSAWLTFILLPESKKVSTS
jgi:hypothetical protein